MRPILRSAAAQRYASRSPLIIQLLPTFSLAAGAFELCPFDQPRTRSQASSGKRGDSIQSGRALQRSCSKPAQFAEAQRATDHESLRIVAAEARKERHRIPVLDSFRDHGEPE